MRAYRLAVICLALTLGGCVGNLRDTFSLRERGPDLAKMPAASTRAATRVVAVGSEIVAQNKDDIGIRPVFFTMGVPEPEISHTRDGKILVSEGLVDRCPTDTELAAVLCHELGKVAADHQAVRVSDGGPAGPSLAPDRVSGGFDADMTNLAARARFDRGGRTGRIDRAPAPDPRFLGQNLFVRTGRKPDDYARVDALIREAEDNADRRASERRQ